MAIKELTGERIARLEEKIEFLTTQEASRLKQEEARDIKIDKLIQELGKYKGFVGGILFVLSCLWAFVKLGLPYLMKLSGKN